MKDLNREYNPQNYVRKKVNIGYHVTKWVVFAIFVIYAFSLAFPFIWMFINALKTTGDFSSGNYFGLPKEFAGNNFIEVLKMKVGDESIGMMFIMSVVMTVLGTLVNVGFSACVAYVIAKFKFPCRGLIYGIAIFTMVVPIVGTLPAQVSMMQTFGLDESILGVLFLYSGAFGFNFILLYSSFTSISNTYMEAASVDGAGRFKTFFKVMLPMAKGPIIACSILTAIGYWNDYQTPFLYMPKEYQTLAVGLQQFQLENQTSYPMVFASMIISIVPILILYLIFQKRILESTNAGGLKG